MKPRPTLKSLRAGQTLFLVSLVDARWRGKATVVSWRLSNADVVCWPWLKAVLSRAYYSRRQALSAACELVRRKRAVDREFLRAMASIFACVSLMRPSLPPPLAPFPPHVVREMLKP